MFKSVEPCVFSEIVDKDNVISEIIKRFDWARTPDITDNNFQQMRTRECRHTK